ncbi:MAG TPA: hypothetical protein VJU83_12670 [Burkholderiales bacterium]|nr:hypothetical protein [Burkholderiales bacterium]
MNDWLPVQEVDLRIEPGSALDFSALIDSPESLREPIGLNADGRLALSGGKGERRRYLCAAMVFSGPHGLFPSHEDADQLARQLKMHGYGLARMHLVDATLMHDRHADFDYSPEQVERFHYLLAALKKQGIRWMIDAATSWNGAYGDVKGRFVREHKLKLSVHYDPASQAHWKKMVSTILAARNPHTGMTILQDPALVAVTLFNELGLNYGSNKGYPPELKQAFRAWLRTQGQRDDGDAPDRRDVSSRAALMQQFLGERERETARWMTAHLRELGFKGLVTAYNNGKSIQAAAARGAMDLVSLHAYHDIPEENARAGSEQEGLSAVATELPYIQHFGVNRYVDRAFIIDEYNHAYWNAWRREAGVAMPAYAAFQDWDGICRYSNPVALRYRKDGPRRSRAMAPFTVGLDPIARAGETLAALLFTRGDVAPAKQQAPILAGKDFFYGQASAVNGMPESLGRLVFVVGTGLLERDMATNAAIKADSTDANAKRAWVHGALSRNEQGWKRNLQHLRASGALPRTNKTAADGSVYESETGEILLEPPQQRMSVQTPKTEAVTFGSSLPSPSAHLKVEEASVPAMVSLSALDGKPLEESRRMLLIVATDAVNSGDRFSADRKVLEALGKLPVLIQPIKLRLLLRQMRANDFNLYALSLTGKRKESIALDPSADGLRFEIDTAKLSSPTTYFELVRP